MKKFLLFCFSLLVLLLGGRGMASAQPQIIASYDFEDDTQDADWQFVNDQNGWFIGSASDVNHTPDGSRAIYVSNNNGTTNAYTLTATDVWAYTDVEIPAGYAEFAFEFYWKCYGESTYDYMKVFVGPTSETSPSGATAPTGAQTLINELRTSNPTYFNGYDGSGYTLKDGWNHFTVTFPGADYAGQTIRLYLYWHNDASVANNPPMAVDDIRLTGSNCGRPHNIAASNTEETSVNITFSPASPDDNAWEYVIGTPGFDLELATPIDIGDTTIPLTDLTTDTPYEIYVRTNCGDEYSAWSEPLTFRTACPEFMILPYMEGFDSYAEGTFPQCWQRNSSTTDYPKVSKTKASSGTHSLYFYSSAYDYDTEYNIGILPAIDILSDPVNTLSLSFKMYKTTASYGACQIGVMTDPADETSFTEVASISAGDLPIDTWKEFEFNLADYAGQGTHIAIRESVTGNSSWSAVTNNFYIDDIAVYTTPTCLKPVDVAVSQITANSAVIDWTPRSDESAWQIAVVPAGEDVEEATFVDADHRPFTADGLSDNTTSDVYVRAICDDGSESVWSYPVTFTTMCLPATVTLPWSENFDGCATGADAALPDCWMKYTDYSTAYPYPDGTQASSGTVSINFYSTTTNYSYLTGPALDLSQYAGSPLLLTCKTFASYSSYGRMNIGYMTDPGDLGTFTLLKALYPSDYAAVNTWYSHDILLPESLPETIYLAFVVPQGGLNTVYLDDVALDYVPDCSAPSNLQFSNIAGASALVSWTASPYGAINYTVEYSEAGQDNWMPISGIADTRVLLSGLMQTTSYDVRVFANCSSGESDTITGTFATGCLAGGEIAIGEGTATNSYLPFYTYYGNSISQQLYLSSELNGVSAYKGIAFYLSSTTATNLTRNISVYLGNTDQSSLSPSTAISSSGQNLVYSGPITQHVGWNDIMFDSAFHYTGGHLVVTVDDNTDAYSGTPNWQVHTGPTSSLYDYDDYNDLDPADPSSITFKTTTYRNNIKIFADCDSTVACVAPNAFITAVDDQSATVEWAPGNGETSWEIEYKPVSDTEWMPVGELHASPHVLNGLTSNENYMLRIRSVCSPDEYSDWTILNFATVCSPVTELPLTEKFDAGTGTDDNYFADCWTRGTNSIDDIPNISGDCYYSGSHSLYFSASSSEYSYAATPRLDESIQMDNLQVSFYMRKTAAAYFIEVGIMTDPKDYNTFVALGTATPSELNTWELAEINTNGYEGTGRYVAFRVPQWIANYIYIDDVTVQYIPVCTRVGNLTVENITANSATVQWTAGGSEDTWEYLYGPAGTVDPDNGEPEQVGTNMVDLDNLESNTAYEVHVRAVCQDGEYSPWTMTGFRTNCLPMDIPYMENFDSYTGAAAGTTTPVSYPDNTMPDCWAFLNRSATSTDYPQAFITSASDYAVTGNCLLFKSSSTTPLFAVLPAFTNDVEELILTFTYRNDGVSAYNGTLSVGVMTDPADVSTFTEVQTCEQTTTKTKKTVNFGISGEAGQKYIVFKYTGGTNNNYFLAIDDITVDLVPGCDMPYGLAVSNLTGTSADLSWQDADEEGTWQIVAAPGGSTPDFTEAVEVTSPSHFLPDLMPNTVYTVYVRTVCSNGEGYSSWTNHSFMTTSDSPAQVPYFHDFEDDAENGEWVLMNGATANKWYIGTPAGAQDGILYVSNDDGQHNAYDNTSSSVWAYRDIQFGDGAEFNLSFKWKAEGETSSYGSTVYDYMQFYIGPPMQVTAGSSTAPENVVFTSERLNLSSNWATANCVLDNSFANTTQRLYFLWVNDNYSNYDPPAAIDSIQITVIECGRPYNLAVSNIGETSADITFTPALLGDGAWQYALGTPGFDPDTAIPEDIYSTSIPLSDLTANTSYEIYVRTVCASGDYSAWSAPIAFKTTCGAFEIPYTENFDGITGGFGVLPECWSVITNYDNFPYTENSSDDTYSSPNALKFAGNNKPTVATPPFADDIHTLMVTFQLKREGTKSDTFEVGVMSNPYDTSSFESVQIITPIDDFYHEYTVYFSNTALSGENNFIAFRQNSTSTNYYYWLDDVVVDLIPTCPPVAGLTATNITVASADISFTEQGSATAWQYVISETALDDPGTGTIEDAEVNPFPVSDLTENTGYFVYVRANCADDDQSTWVGTTFRTSCEDIVVDQDNPFVEDFENEGQMPDCWSQEYVSGTQDWTFQTGGGSSNVSNAHGGNYNANFREPSFTANETYLISPVLDLSACIAAKLTFWHTQPAWGTDQSQLRVYYRTSADETWTLIPGAEFTSSITAWTEEGFALPLPSATYQIAFKATNTYSYGLCLDDVTVRPQSSENDILTFSLPEQTGESVIDAEAHTVAAVISYSADITAQTPVITVSEYATLSPASGVQQDFTDPVTYTVTAEDGTTQEWTVTVTQMAAASSEKDIIAFTFTGQTGEAEIDNTVHTVNALAEWDLNLTAIAPAIEVSGMATISPASGVAQDFTNPVTYTVTAEDNSTQDWTVTIINDPDACPNPTITAEPFITATTLQVTWDKVYNETSYNAAISTADLSGNLTNVMNDAEFTQVVTLAEGETTASVEFTGLSPQTHYYAYLQSNCGTEEWVINEFETACVPVEELPYTENFDSYTGGTSSFPDCWTATTKYNNYPYIESSTTYAHSSPNALKFAGKILPTAATPQFAADIHTLMVTFQLKREGASSGTFEVGVMSNPNDAATFEPVQTITPIDDFYHEYTVYFPNTELTGENNCIAFRQSSTSIAWYYWLDDVVVDLIPTCLPVIDLTATNITGSTADISFTEQGSATTWQYVISETALDDPATGNIVDVTTNPFTVPDLETNTTYYVYVRANCSENDQSSWAGTTFRTACGVIAVNDENPFVESFEDNSETRDCWSQEYVMGNDYSNDAWELMTSSTDAHGGEKYYKYTTSGSMDCHDAHRLITPTLDLTGATAANLNFWYKTKWYNNYSDTLQVYYRTSTDADWTLLRSYTTNTTDTWTEDSIMLDNLSSTFQLSFVGYYNWGYGVWLDDVTVSVVGESCPMPTNLTVTDITENTVTLTWEQQGDVSEWTLNSKCADENSTWTTTIIGTNPYTIEGLTANTDYQVQLRANCGDGIYSNYTDIVTFTTTGIETYMLSNSISLYPNPTSDYIDVKFNQDIRVRELKVYDIYGKLLQTVQVNENPTRINVSGLSNGVYFVRAITEKGIANKSFIKQ